MSDLQPTFDSDVMELLRAQFGDDIVLLSRQHFNQMRDTIRDAGLDDNLQGITFSELILTAECRHCGEEIHRRPNPNGPEIWSDPDGLNYGCLQRAYNEWDRTSTGAPGDEPQAPYPPHEPLEER